MSIDVTQNLKDKFSFKPMQEMMAYLATYNTATQAVAIDATPADIQTTGTGYAMINGQPELLEQDAALDISACTEGTETAWATATSYTAGNIREHKDTRLRCILAHTSVSAATETATSIGNEPFVSANWDLYWEVAPHGAVNASGTSITKGYDQWFIILAKATGVISIWEAGAEAATGTAICKIPQFDPKEFVAVGFLHIANGTSSAFVVGTTSLATSSVTDTFVQIVGPVFPHPDNWDTN